jgi:hypothetical protein
MRQVFRILLCAALLCAFLGIAATSTAQTVTTGTLTGVVADAQKGVLPGATVIAVHVPTGTTYEAVTQGDGRFTFLAVRVGGPYAVTANIAGFKAEKREGIMVGLGEERMIDFTLGLQSIQETVTVTAEAQLIETSRAGTADAVKSEVLQSLPTVSRGLEDFARTSPYFNATSYNGGSTFLSVSGRNNRYNNVQIDGAVNNDLFGLSPSGTPGGDTGTQPISLDAIQELQLLVSPYDVRQGGFSGGGVNAITKNGTNQLRGTGYYFALDQRLVGDGPVNKPIAAFKNKQGGFSLGGPAVKNKLFFFGNFDAGRRTQPVGYSLDGNSGAQWGTADDRAIVQKLVDVVRAKYGFDAGGGADPFAEYSKPSENNKIFVRADVNLSNKHRLTARFNYIDAFGQTVSVSASSYSLPSMVYQYNSNQKSFVTQLNSTFGTAFNELRIGYQTIDDHRTTPGSPFPQTQLDLPSGKNVRFGTEQFSQANALRQNILEITDDFTIVRGKHTFTFGTHNELITFENLYIQDLYGTYRFAPCRTAACGNPTNSTDPTLVLANFISGMSNGYDVSYANPAVISDPRWAASFPVRQYGFYAGDQWRLAKRFTLTYGIRWDRPQFPQAPNANPDVTAKYPPYSTQTAPTPSSWSPRVGFNWDMSTDKTRQQVRGGAGLFSGRTPYVWLSNQYSNTGMEFIRPSVTYSSTGTPSVAFVADTANPPKNLGAAGTQDVNLIDPAYKYPQLIRGNLAYDRDLGFFGLKMTGELLFSRIVKDIKYQDINLVVTSTTPDGRPYFGKRYTTYNGAYTLLNTNEGSTWSLALKIDRPWRNGLYFSGSYMFGRSRTIMDGTSSRAVSNWNGVYVPGDPNNPPLAISNFDPGHRVMLQASYDIPVYKEFKVTASVFYNAQQGRPYSTLFSGDVNKDNRTTNDLIYIPTLAEQQSGKYLVSNGTWDQFNNYVYNDPSLWAAVGSIPERNTARGPWWHQMDTKFAFNVPTHSRFRPEITFDILNFLNLLNNTWGVYNYAAYQDLMPVLYSYSSTTGKATYNLSPLNNGAVMGPWNMYTLDDLRSRWQMQIGLRLRF